jgi:hypothetical protein
VPSYLAFCSLQDRLSQKHVAVCGAQTGRITATYRRVIGYRGQAYSMEGIAFWMGNSQASAKACVGLVIVWIGLPKRTARAHVAPRFALI